jgi:acetyl esterase/lipase
MKKVLFFLSVTWSIIFLILFSSCSKKISISKNITYRESIPSSQIGTLQLDIFSPHDKNDLKNVFVFFHGGGWDSGKKSLYSFLGKRLARKNVVAVIVDYPLSPKANYKDMAMAAALSVQWIKNNIKQYGGNPERIFVSGHSAGGHLAALISVKNDFFDSLKISNPIKGTILIDAAGLDMYGYLKEQHFKDGFTYLKTFSTDTTTWKEASPLYYLHPGVPPMSIYVGERTYPNIKSSNQKFEAELVKYSTSLDFKIVKRKRHIPMIFQLYNSQNIMYNEMIDFMKRQK